MRNKLTNSPSCSVCKTHLPAQCACRGRIFVNDFSSETLRSFFTATRYRGVRSCNSLQQGPNKTEAPKKTGGKLEKPQSVAQMIGSKTQNPTELRSFHHCDSKVCAHDDVTATIRVHNTTHLSNFQRKRCFLFEATQDNKYTKVLGHLLRLQFDVYTGDSTITRWGIIANGDSGWNAGSPRTASAFR